MIFGVDSLLFFDSLLVDIILDYIGDKTLAQTLLYHSVRNAKSISGSAVHMVLQQIEPSALS